ncbi:hypothetical protein EJ082_01645 [Brevundimonas diminuta]|uniref:hypothetical protein n=1 Tax=Brevundimonas diminuta TaxID=293 RepID=UPI00168B0120|nr:hypothetical protein [Brevundimonas diminuta]MBD3571680.1 hypothetical protein [Brevundimonas diminuta]
MTDIPDMTRLFIERCDAFAASRGVKRSTLSVWLFNDGKRLDQIASGTSDVGVQRLHRAAEALCELEVRGAA